MEPTITSFGTNVSLVEALIAKEKANKPPVQIGPGRRTIHTYHKGLGRERYTGRRLRQIRAERGVGRPPESDWSWFQIQDALEALTENQRQQFLTLVRDCIGDLDMLKVHLGAKGRIWQQFVAKLDALGLIEPGRNNTYRVSRFGLRCANELYGGA